MSPRTQGGVDLTLKGLGFSVQAAEQGGPMPRVQRMFSRISTVIALIGLTACSDSGGGVVIPGESPGAVAGVAVSPSASTIQVGLNSSDDRDAGRRRRQ